MGRHNYKARGILWNKMEGRSRDTERERGGGGDRDRERRIWEGGTEKYER